MYGQPREVESASQGDERASYNIIHGFHRNWEASRVLTMEQLENFQIPDGQTLNVYFHSDGGQCCGDGVRTFTDVARAALFAQNKMNEPGHYCTDSVKIFLSPKSIPEEGAEDLRASEPTLQEIIARANMSQRFQLPEWLIMLLHH